MKTLDMLWNASLASWGLRNILKSKFFLGISAAHLTITWTKKVPVNAKEFNRFQGFQHKLLCLIYADSLIAWLTATKCPENPYEAPEKLLEYHDTFWNSKTLWNAMKHSCAALENPGNLSKLSQNSFKPPNVLTPPRDSVNTLLKTPRPWNSLKLPKSKPPKSSWNFSKGYRNPSTAHEAPLKHLEIL